MESLKLKKYLLGNLDEKATEEISLRIIDDESFEDEMMIAENALMEDFLDGALSAEEIKLFNSNFLISEERKIQLKEIALISAYAKSGLQRNLVTPEKGAFDLRKNLKAIFSFGFNPQTAILTILIICALAGITWRVFLYDANAELTQLEREFSVINQKDLNGTPGFSGLTNIGLIQGTFRDSNSTGKLELAKTTDIVIFRLVLPFPTAEKEFLKAEFIKDEKTVFTQNQARIYKNQSGQEVKIAVPKSILRKGEFQINLENPNPSAAPPIKYAFVVE